MANLTTHANQPWRAMRRALWRSIRFLIIVWTLAGAFILLDAAWLYLSKHLANAGIVLWHSVPSAISVATASPIDHCKRELEQWERAHPARDRGLDLAKHSLEFAWAMGFEVGFVAGPVAIGRSTVEDASKRLEKAKRLATVLQAPSPTLPKVKHIARAMSEFHEYIETDPQCIAAYLGQTFSPQHGALYRFGEALGFSTAMRMMFAEGGTVSGPQIRRYGKQADLPESMWIGFARENKTPLPGSDVQARLDGVTRPFHRYFACQREGGVNCSATTGGK